MADPEHVNWLLEGEHNWNARRKSAPFAPFLMWADIFGEFERQGLLDQNGRVRLNRFNLSDANLAGADLRNADFFETNLRGTKLYSARLDGADFSGADLAHAEFGIGSLSNAAFSSSSLNNADLRQTNFANADLGWSQLWMARIFPDVNESPQFDADLCQGHAISGMSAFLDFFANIEARHGPDVLYYFRGESSSGWDLRPSVMRPEADTSNFILRLSEGRMLTELMRRRPEEFVPSTCALDEWVIGQHHGLKTRFLDITKDPRIALYNASYDERYADKTGLIYVFAVPRHLVKPYNDENISIIANFAKLERTDQNVLLTKTGSQMQQEDPNRPIGYLYTESLRRLCKLIQGERPQFEPAMIDARDFFRVFVVEPRQINERIRAQSGAFLVSAFHERFERDQILSWNPQVPVYANYTLTIPSGRKHAIMRELGLLNVTQETLYPGLDSSAAAIIDLYRMRE